MLGRRCIIDAIIYTTIIFYLRLLSGLRLEEGGRDEGRRGGGGGGRGRRRIGKREMR